MTTTPDLKVFRRRFWQTIQCKLVLLLAFLFIPTVLIQAYVHHERFKAHRAEQFQANLEIARAVAKAFDSFVQDVLHQELSLGLAFTSSQTLSDEEKNEILSRSQAGNPAIWHFFWDNPAGVVIAATGSQFIGMDVSDREFYREIVAGKDWVVSDLLLSKTTHKPSFTISRSIRNEKGELLGIIVAGILPERLKEALGIKRSEGGGVSLLDRQGRLVFRFPETTVSWEERDWLNYYPEQVKAVLDGKEIIAEVFARYSKKQRLAGFAPVASIGWAAAAGRTEDDAMAAITATILPQTILVLLLTVVVFGISLFFTRKISTSVTKLRNHASLLGRGERRDFLEVSGFVELHDLAVSLDSMAEEISEREARIRALAEKAEEKAVEAANERNRLEAVMEALPVGVAVLDEHGGNIKSNKAFQQIWGDSLPSAESIEDYSLYKAWWADTGELVKPEEWASARAVQKGETVIGQVMRITRFDGTSAFVHNSASPIRDVHGGIVGSSVAIMDITEHKRAEQMLRESEFHLARSQELAHLGGWAWDILENRLYWSDETYRIFGLPPEGLVGQSSDFLRFVHPEDLDRVEQTIKESLVHGRYNVEFRIIREGGEERYLHSNARTAFDQDGNPVKMEGYVQDITERKQAEKALRDSERMYRAIGESIDYGVWICEPDGKNIYASESFLKLVGLTQQECSEFGWGDVLHPEDAEATLAAWQECVQTGRIWDIQHRFRGIDGQWHPILARGVPIKDENNRTIYWAGINLDISTLKEMEQELRKSRDDLELRVSERTAELERSNQALQDFASIASHDLQEPLRKVMTFGNMLKRKYTAALDDSGKDYLDRVLGATGRMQTLLESLLEYSRVTTGSEPFKEVALSDLIQEVLSDLEVRIEKTGGTVEVGILPIIQAAPTQMRQLFQNLIGNALKFHKDEEKPVVRISCIPGNEGVCQITVEDNGIGFEEQYLNRILAPFQRLHGKNSKYEGTGMGLAICAKIVERHGGSLTAKSSPGAGSTFIIKLPGAQI